ncbi:hypothetical protein V6N13_004307 [Hibiscus sabdariffa]
MGEYKMPKAYEQERVVEQEKIIDVVLQCYTDLIIGDKINLFVGKMLGQIFVTKQTGPQGKVVSKVYLGQKLCLVNEMYFTITPDRNTTDLSIVACSKGETNFEGHIKKYPDMIIKVPIAIFIRITDEDAAKRVDGLTPKVVDRTDSIEQVKKLYKLFYEADCALLEINSLPETSSNQLVDADAKLNFNDNFAFRHKYIYSLCDQSQEDPQEVATAKADLTYTCLHGEISCMVNGVGLAMATMHIIKLRGGTATKFFEVDGNASEGQVVEVFKILTSDEKLKFMWWFVMGKRASAPSLFFSEYPHLLQTGEDESFRPKGIVILVKSFDWRIVNSEWTYDMVKVLATAAKSVMVQHSDILTAVVLSCWYPTES